MQETWPPAVRLPSGRGKRQRPGLKGRHPGRHQPSPKSPPTSTPLVGSSNVVEVRVGGECAGALLDTGSMVSTVAASLVRRLQLPVQRVTDLVTVQGVGGQTLPYQGYVEADITIRHKGGRPLTAPTLLLVVDENRVCVMRLYFSVAVFLFGNY